MSEPWNSFDLTGKTVVVMGALNKRSLGYAAAKAASDQGANVILTYQSPDHTNRIEKLGADLNLIGHHQCDVGDDASLDACFAWLAEQGPIHGFVHSIGFAAREELGGPCITSTTRDNFKMAMDISCFSLLDVARRAQPLMTEGGTIVTLSFYAAQQVFLEYNAMAIVKAALEAAVRTTAVDLGYAGIRVCGVSASPANTAAAAGVGNRHVVDEVARMMAPDGKVANLEEIGAACAFLMSTGGGALNGAILPVNHGVQIAAHPWPWNLPIALQAMDRIAGLGYQPIGMSDDDFAALQAALAALGLKHIRQGSTDPVDA